MTAAIVVAVAAALRVIPWLANYPLHRDEALYGFWARLIASGRDPLLLTPWIDKPPLVPYLLAASLRIFGASEPALRAPGMLAGLLTLLVTFGCARRAYGSRPALLAAALLAVSPFAISFAPTAFTDPWLTLWLMAAAWAALSGRGFLAGLALGLAVASKQQGVLGAPLVIALLVQRCRGAKVQRCGGALAQEFSSAPLRPCPPAPLLLRSSAPPLLRSVLGFALIFAPMTWWDSLRWSNRPSFWNQGAAAYGGLGLASPAQWIPRAAAWAEQLGYLFGVPLFSAAVLLLAAGAGGVAWRRLLRRGSAFPGPEASAGFSEQRARPTDASIPGDHPNSDTASQGEATTDAILAAFVFAYLALHLFATFQPWDRYLLPILPLVCILAARGLTLIGYFTAEAPRTPKRIQKSLRSRRLCGDSQDGLRWAPAGSILRGIVAAALIAGMGYSAALGVAGRLPVGSDHGAYAGLDRVVATLRAQPENAIIYHRWLSWHYDFYLFDAPQERRWWDTGWKLAEEAGRTARAEPQRPQWVVFPAWASATGDDEGVRLPLASKGLALTEVNRIHRPDGSVSFTLYRIAPLDLERSQ